MGYDIYIREGEIMDWFSMDDTFSCANCGRVSDRYDMEQSRGEWYCMEGEGCQAKPSAAVQAKVDELTKGTGMCPSCGEHPVEISSEYLDGTAEDEVCEQDLWCHECRM